jgi:hypothetical protein
MSRFKKKRKPPTAGQPLYVVRIAGGYIGRKSWIPSPIEEATRYTAKAGRARVDRLQSHNMRHPEAVLEPAPPTQS